LRFELVKAVRVRLEIVLTFDQFQRAIDAQMMDEV
jgi:hypothetical protein